MRSSTETLVEALRILARDIQSGDGAANAAIAEAAERLEELHQVSRLTHEVRQAQKAYLRYRTPDALQQSKQLEAQLDKALLEAMKEGSLL